MDHENKVDLSKHRLSHELTLIQSHMHHQGAMPTDRALNKLQDQAKLETQKIADKIQLEQISKLQREASLRQGMRM